ncbi:MAG: glycosyltransferase family 2 protein [Alphaproteobacteria bacterium]|nr:glycosyltransferase family 2 protein [Alphaproteobacteria bacterium]
MRNGQRIGVVIPALDEEEAIGKVIADIPGFADAIVVADNGSRDGTAEMARAAGAIVVREDEAGYGAACLAGLAVLPPVDIVVFLDGDYSDYPQDLAQLVDPIVAGKADLVIGSRILGGAEPGALTPQQVFGNWLATRLIAIIWGERFTDLGPFRAIRFEALAGLDMADRDFGWTVEMQVKAARAGLACHEVPVRYRKRIGTSKISGTIRGTIKAGLKILSVIGWHAVAAGSKNAGRGD